MRKATLELLDRLEGTWSTEATHPALPGLVVHGITTIEWLEGRQFLIHRGRTDHPDFPHAISVIGMTDRDRVDDPAADQPATVDDSRLSMHYFDSRGVFRVYEVSIDENEWRIWRDAPGFSQRFTGTLSDEDGVIAGQWQSCEDDVHWQDDLRITYRRLA